MNPDSHFPPKLIKNLIEKIQERKNYGIVDVTQRPVDHPKEYDKKTGETPWASGSCMMLRREALNKTGLFDEKLFMYTEDIDLSWRMWLNGYKCIHSERAIYYHGLDDGSVSHKAGQFYYHYYPMRNGVIMRIIYGNLRDVLSYYKILFGYIAGNIFQGKGDKLRIVKAILDSFRLIPHALMRRAKIQKLNPKGDKHIRFYGINYSKHRFQV